MVEGRKLRGVVAVCLCGLLLRAVPAKGQASATVHGGGRTAVSLAVEDGNGGAVAGAAARGAGARPVAMDFERVYQPGDRIVLRGPRRVALRVDATMPECLLYLPGSLGGEGEFDYIVPYGRAEKETGSAYDPASFAGSSHHVTARPWTDAERTGYRNLALNPCDLLEPQEGSATAYPHSSTNSYSRNLYDFAARNAIDGVTQDGHHGTWPYQSWGPGLRLDLWWKLDFGRPVELDKIRLLVRTHFPHDSYWKSAVVEFSDGSLLPITITNSGEFQEFSFPKRQVTWFRLNNLVPEDPARWCALMEVEAWGRDLP